MKFLADMGSVILFRLGNENYHVINECLTEILSQCQEDLQGVSDIVVVDPRSVV
ncbi:hypothetical protein IQ226_09555 [Dolichospermum sp. LEGE 00240]|uniref:hypothetical protein n=1 Tax=Dolichospermum sp. LEGE 00240 TaxID=1828603 RepID=UPI00187F6970|nr:hypothetical protein [Dolichospermum sp. LEGE 00240]MBE9249407.1 hypothetical protein [Dolichospermum sp. LEGE 00240]